MSQDRLKVYFPGLNGLRFFAALAVIISHIEMVFQRTEHDTYWYWLEARMKFNGLTTVLYSDSKFLNFFVTLSGYCGVIFFFVLSGFLITYLLLVEKEKTGSISIKDFYLRRLLRIWPLYYLLVFVGFFILPKIQWFDLAHDMKHFSEAFLFKLSSFIFMAPNLASSYFVWHVPNIGHFWSIGVEEQFYLFWPVLIKLFSRTKKMILVFIVSVIAFKAFLLLVPVFSPGFTKFIGSMKFEAMAIGALGAYWVYNKKDKILRLIYSVPVQLISFAALPGILLLLPYGIFETMYLFLAVPFLIIILNVATNPKSILKSNNTLFDYLGKISYGLYMYHLIICTLVINLYTAFFESSFQLTLAERTLIYIAIILLTIIASGLSYRYIELPFIRMKGKYTRVISGEQAKEKIQD